MSEVTICKNIVDANRQGAPAAIVPSFACRLANPASQRSGGEADVCFLRECWPDVLAAIRFWRLDRFHCQLREPPHRRFDLTPCCSLSFMPAMCPIISLCQRADVITRI